MIDKIIPTALRLWLGFLFLFLLLGYSAVPSVVFSAIAGFAGGMIAAWWITPGGEPTLTELPESIRQIGRRIKENPSRLPFLRLFNRHDRRYSRPKR